MITGDYTLPVNTNWLSVQFQDVYLDCDTTDADVNLTLPNIADLNRYWGVRLHILNKVGTNKVNIIAFTQLSPAVTNLINGVATIVLPALGDSAIVTVEDELNWIAQATSATTGVPTVLATLAKATLATTAYKGLPVGSALAVTNYATTGDGVTLVKTTLANNTFADWRVIATENPTSTGHIGQVPA